MLNFYLTKGDSNKLNTAFKVDGRSSYFKAGTSMNLNGEKKFSLGVSTPTKTTVTPAIEIELFKKEEKVTR